MNFIDLFKEQLDKAVPCDGDYLGGKTFEEALRVHISHKFIRSDFEPISPTERSQRVARTRLMLECKVREWKDHVGERICYFIVEKFDPHSPDATFRMSVLKVWENDIPDLAETYEPVDYPKQPKSGTFPRLKERPDLSSRSKPNR